jgi:hypothetical protein
MDYSFGFRCSSDGIENIEKAELEGVCLDSNGLRVLPKWAQHEICVTTQKPKKRLRLCRPGISISIMNPVTGLEEICECGERLLVASNDTRRVIVHLEISGEWKIIAGKNIVADTETGSLREAFRLNDLMQSEANNSTLLAVPANGLAPIKILHLHREIVVTGFKIARDQIEQRYYVRFIVPSDVKQCAIARRACPASTHQNKNTFITAIPLSPDAKVCDITDLIGSAACVKSADVRSRWCVEIFIPYKSIGANWQMGSLINLSY